VGRAVPGPEGVSWTLALQGSRGEVLRLATPGGLGCWKRPRLRAEATRRELAQADLVSALLHRCRSLRMPLPRRGQKALEMMGDRVAMTVMLNTEPTLVETHQGAICYSDAEAARLRPR